MKVRVRSEGYRFTIPVPLSLMPIMLRIAGRFTDIGDDKIAAAIELCRALKGARRSFRGLELVHVVSSDGDEVVVIL